MYLFVLNNVKPYSFPFLRIDQQPSAILQHIQYVLLIGFGYLASAVLAPILQSEKTHRLNACAHTQSKQCTSQVLFLFQQCG